jgi:hypothetical protein
MGRAGPGRPEKVPGRSDWRITGETAAAYDDVIGAADSARLPFLPAASRPAVATATAGDRTPAPATEGIRPRGAAVMAARAL